ncbi:ATP-binding protein [Terrimonas sp. NA20]|uniref:histidine kinase n=1 Tax=Terrimonas ginsenosidimutans TaxID=2908004 RepID=A0ABS9KLT0_9BACT|nr:ATP-binding protein [Terrimonas ginsenosidimutans]MCG2613282.1 ATP-binding protein [Terrimonas ginsenosidimutans]
MKLKLIYTVSLLLLTAAAFTQPTAEDLKRREEGSKKPDSNFIKFMLEEKWLNHRDSTEKHITETIALARRINYVPGIDQGTDILAQHYYNNGRMSDALHLLLVNQAHAVKRGDSTSVFRGLRMIVTIYMKTGDLKMAKAGLDRRQVILDQKSIPNSGDTSYFAISQLNSLAQYYGQPKIDDQDSIQYFFRKIYVSGQHTSFENLWTQLGAGGLGRVFLKTGQTDSALYYLNIATRAALEGKRLENYYGFVSVKSDVFLLRNQIDSAFKTAYEVYNGAEQNHLAGIALTGSGQLANLYKKQQRYDSAVKYLTIESSYKDSLFGKDAVTNIQVLTNEQQLKSLEAQREKEEAISEYKNKVKNYLFAGGVLLLLIIIAGLYRISKQRALAKRQIESAYDDLKITQAQLVQSEKMASLGELTAGIAHEIQNPLNFVNNFSEVSHELIDEMNEELDKGDIDEAKAIGNDIKQNLEKITHHGKRADAIVKGMLQHSRTSSGQKEMTDINALCDEYLRLAFHGLRAKDKTFNANFETSFDQSIGRISVMPQEIGRVILNLINNAFYAVTEKGKQQIAGYKPTVTVTTQKNGSKILIQIKDNGTGIPQTALDKIFQPFFTTKPTGQGTGLGLSMSYDIITKGHGGELKAETTQGERTVFTIQLPTN